MCKVDYDLDGAEPSVWRDTPRRARKAHACTCCGAAIAPGDAYRDHVAIADGVTYAEKGCAACVETIDAFGKAHHALYAPSQIVDALEECVDEGDDGHEGWQAALEAIRARQEARAAS